MRTKGSLVIALSICCGLSVPCGFAATAGGADQQDASIDAAVDAALSGNEEITYPQVTKLEGYILGQTYEFDPLPKRLARLETKAFGKPSTDPDLSARTDALTDYAAKKLGKKTPVAPDDDSSDDGSSSSPRGSAGSNTNSGSSSSNSSTSNYGSDTSNSMDGGDSGSSDDDGAPGTYPHITALEKEILGQTYPQDQLPQRLARMETKAFGKPSANSDLSDRTDALDKYTQKTLHKESFDKQQAQQAEQNGYLPAAGGGAGGGSGGQRTKQVLNFLGSQLLGMAIPVPGLANTLIGARAIPASALGQQGSSDDSAPKPPPEDPAVFAQTPPPPNARMATQVGWCEMRVFGHTSPQLHLTERLNQLNSELNFAPNQKGSELMDDMPKLMLAAQSRPPS